MSRHSHNDVWKHHNDLNPTAPCPSCNLVTLYREALPGQKRNWQRGHIIHHKNQGPDILENIRPICLQCNANDKAYYSNYHYMVSLGLMTLEDAKRGCEVIMSEYDRKRQDPKADLCIANTKSGARCKHKKKPRSMYCEVHGKAYVANLEAFYKEQFYGELSRIKRTMRMFKETDDVEAIKVLMEYVAEMGKVVKSF